LSERGDGGFFLSVGIHRYFTWWGNVKERDHLDELGVDARIILRFILEKKNKSV